eukprot:EC786646.1.p1 GENE.EC786646.1~~EC786646.1.p1  ORF type:complete len:94 (-),score=14.70 EC786646.1:4-285(-)
MTMVGRSTSHLLQWHWTTNDPVVDAEGEVEDDEEDASPSSTSPSTSSSSGVTLCTAALDEADNLALVDTERNPRRVRSARTIALSLSHSLFYL